MARTSVPPSGHSEKLIFAIYFRFICFQRQKTCALGVTGRPVANVSQG